MYFFNKLSSSYFGLFMQMATSTSFPSMEREDFCLARIANQRDRWNLGEPLTTDMS